MSDEFSAGSESSPSMPWCKRAPELALWAFERLVNRTDRDGGYYRDWKTGKVNVVTKPNAAAENHVNLQRLAGHFSASRVEDLIGLHGLGATSMGKWAAIDIDAHSPDE